MARNSQGAPLSSDIAANAAVEQLNGMLRYAIGLEFGEDAPGEFPGVRLRLAELGARS